jgi:hypothetical protein
MINIVIPFSRPNFKKNVVENIKRQNYNNKKIIIVENGKGVGCFKNTNLDCVILTSGQHHALAKNEGINWIKKHGGGLWVTFDDDDYYGPEYLSEIIQNRHKGNVLGKHDRFLKSEDNKLFLMYDGVENNYSQCVLGPTISAMAEESCEFQEVVHDDMLFTYDMKQKGATIYATSRYNFIQCRYNHSHMWKITANQIVQNSLDANCKVIEFDDINYDIVNSKIPICNYKFVEKERPSLEHSAIYMQNKDTETPFKEFIKSYGVEPVPALLDKLKVNA